MRRTLVAGGRHAILQRARGEQAQLNLDGRNGMHGIGTPDRRSADLAQADAADLALGDQLGQCLDGRLDRHLRVDARALEDVDLLHAVEDTKGLVDRGANALGAGVGRHGLEVESALDAQDDLIGVLGVTVEVVLEHMEGVGVRGAIEETLFGTGTLDEAIVKDATVQAWTPHVGCTTGGRRERQPRNMVTHAIPEVDAIVERRLQDLVRLIEWDTRPREA